MTTDHTDDRQEIHTARASASSGHVRTDDSGIDVALTSPLAPDGKGVTPEQILAAGYAACFLAAVGDSEARLGQVGGGAEVAVTVDLTRDDDGAYAVDVRVELGGDLDHDRLAELVQAADRTWPYTAGNPRSAISVRAAGSTDEGTH